MMVKSSQASAENPFFPTTSMGQFLLSFLRELERLGMAYVILRNYEGLPDEIGHDVDLLVVRTRDDQAVGTKNLDQIALTVSKNSDWSLVRLIHRYHFSTYYFAGPKEQNERLFLKVDIWQELLWRGMLTASTKAIVENRVCYRGLWVANPANEAAVSLVKEFLPFGWIKEKYKSRIAASAKSQPDEFRATIEPYLGQEATDFILSCVCREEWDILYMHATHIRRRFILRAILANPAQQLISWGRFVWSHLTSKVFRPSGLFVCLIGPDGSGKTTISKSLQRDMEALFGVVCYYHAHWGLLPELKTYSNLFRGLFGQKSRETVQVRDVVYGENNLSLIRALLYVFYYSLEYFLGYLPLLLAKGQGKLVLFDRYFYDYEIHASFRRVPRWLFQLIEMVLPRPDMLIWLRNEPEVIHRRKAELSVSQIREQAIACNKIVERQSEGAYVIWTDDNSQITLGLVKKKIFELMAHRINRIST